MRTFLAKKLNLKLEDRNLRRISYSKLFSKFRQNSFFLNGPELQGQSEPNLLVGSGVVIFIRLESDSHFAKGIHSYTQKQIFT